jgi:hypothetical protein
MAFWSWMNIRKPKWRRFREIKNLHHSRVRPGRGRTGIELGEIPCLLLLLMLLLLLSKLLPGSKIMIESKSKMGLAPLLNSMAAGRGRDSTQDSQFSIAADLV